VYLVKNWDEIESELREIKKSMEQLKPIVRKMPGVIPAANIKEFHQTMHRIDKIVYAFERITYTLNLLETSKEFSRVAKNIEKGLGRHFREITNMRKDLEELFFGKI
jgi:hypothetical protein